MLQISYFNNRGENITTTRSANMMYIEIHMISLSQLVTKIHNYWTMVESYSLMPRNVTVKAASGICFIYSVPWGGSTPFFLP